MKAFASSVLIIATISIAAATARGQGSVHTLFGDLQVDEGSAESLKPLVYEVVLYNLGGLVVSRQFVNAGGRYRFMNISNGQYYLAVLLDHEEIGRVRVEILAPLKNDFRQDISLAWRAGPKSRPKHPTVSASDFYKRTKASERLFAEARKAADKKRYEEAVSLLQRILKDDRQDFQAWTELGTLYLLQANYDAAEKAYQQAIAVRPSFLLALLNLGRLRNITKNHAGAVEPLVMALKLKPDSADVNYHLGEAYLQLKKGSSAVSCFYKALEVDPLGKADAHLRLATLYDAAGMKQKAAAEYAAFLKKKPDYANRTKLEKYIALNKGTVETKTR